MAEEQNPGQTTPGAGETQGTPNPAQSSGQPAQQPESYWQGQYDSLKNSQEYQQKEKLWKLYQDNPGLVENSRTFLSDDGTPSVQAPPSDFDANFDFNMSDVTNPNSPSAQLFNQAVQAAAEPLVQERVGKIEEANARAVYRDKMVRAGVPNGEVDEFLGNMMNPSETFVFDQLVPLVAQHYANQPPAQAPQQVAPQAAPQATPQAQPSGLPPAESGIVGAPIGDNNLDGIRATQRSSPATGEVQGAAPPPQPTELDSIWGQVEQAIPVDPFE